MADTRRGVSWALERACPLRQGQDWPLPEVTHRQLADITAYAGALHEQRVVEDVCVTAYTYGFDNNDEGVMLPHAGFRVSLALAPFGGEAAVRAACSACEANVAAGDARPDLLAGCHGFREAWPDSEEWEDALREAIRLKGLGERARELFPRTEPLWYGFWITSPLRRLQCELLLELLEGTDDPDDRPDDDLRHFLAALRAAVRWELPLHVAVPPPGLTDLGWYTVFPHCPRCKVHAPVARWQESYPDEPLDCPVCGHRYSPAATYKAEPMDEAAFDAGRLENLLGAGAVEPFCRRFLAHRECSTAQVDAVLDREHHGPQKRRINAPRQRQEMLREALPARPPATGPLPPELTLELADDLALRLRLIPAGAFLMGTDGPPDEVGSEGPQHRVQIARPFYLAEFPVTQAQFEAVLGYNPSRFQGDADRPAEQVSWFAAQEFCLRLSQRVGRRVRLPSEAEWEYACRAGTTTPYHWGDEATDDRVNCKTGDPFTALSAGVEDVPAGDVEWGGAPAAQTSVQGRYPANAWGLIDMHGNVQEWCEDEWHDTYAGAPADGSAWVTAGDENPFRPVWGGSCWHYATACTAAAWQSLRADADDEPEEFPEDSLFAALLRDRPPVGFRVVCAID